MNRRTPLARRTPLKRGGPIRRRRPPSPSRRPEHTPAEQAHLDAVADLGCLVCGAPALIHHVRSLDGKRITRNHMLVLPLCWRHHSADSPDGFHAGSKPWQKRHGSEKDLLAKVAALLAQRSTVFQESLITIPRQGRPGPGETPEAE